MTLYRLINKDGKPLLDNHTGNPRVFHSAADAAAAARAKWPDQDQDEDRNGTGWDIQAIRPSQ